MPELESVDAAAKHLGITRGYLYKVENGEKKPSFEMLEAMAEAYGVLMGDLLPSSAPRGPEVDRILGPIAALPPEIRSSFITQVEGMARVFMGAANAMRSIGYAEARSEAGAIKRPADDLPAMPIGM